MLTIHLCVAAYFKSRDGTSWATSMVWINGVPRGRSTAGAFIVPLVTNQVTKIHQSTWLTKKKKISALSAKLQVARVGSPLVPQCFPTTPASPPPKKCGAVLLLLAFGSCSWCGGSTASMWGPRIPQHRGMGRNWKTCWWTPSFSYTDKACWPVWWILRWFFMDPKLVDAFLLDIWICIQSFLLCSHPARRNALHLAGFQILEPCILFPQLSILCLERFVMVCSSKERS